jgi:molybdate transport repressor ModE-like protein
VLLVESSVGGVRGGGASLTGQGRALLERYRALEANVMKLVSAEAADLMKLFEV